MVVLKEDGCAFAIGHSKDEAVMAARCKQAALLWVNVEEVWANTEFAHDLVILKWKDSAGQVWRRALEIRTCL